MTRRRKSKQQAKPATKELTPAAKRKQQALEILQQLPRVDPNARYSIPAACLLLWQSEAQTYEQMKRGEIKTITQGGRTFIPGSEIVKLSTLPGEAQAVSD